MKEYILRLSLKGTDITRTVAISEDMTFFELHNIIQILFGWGDNHMHHFKIDSLVIGDYDDEDDIPPNYTYEGEADLDVIIENEPEFLYEYDFGDGWQVCIKVLEIKNRETDTLPVVLESHGQMATDDCGGIEGLKSIPWIKADLETLNMLLAQYYREK